jgi:ribosomal-protein-alanine N-acetyltransferase
MTADPTEGRSTVLETERLLLRLLTTGDLDHLAALYRDPDVRRYFPEGTLTYDQTREELQWTITVHYRRHGFGLWATVLKETGAFVGRCGLLSAEIDGRPEVEVAYLLDRGHWGRGLGSEAARGIVDHAFASLPVDRLVSMFEPANRASRGVATAVGMTPFREGYVDAYGVSDVYAIRRPRAPAG